MALNKAYLIFLLFINASAFAQKPIDIRLTIVSKESSLKLNDEVGLLIDIKNFSDKNFFLYSPMGKIINHIKFYKLNRETGNYEEIIHPSVEEVKREIEVKNNIFQDNQTIINLSGLEDYNWKSDLYKEFVKADSLRHNFEVINSQYARSITKESINEFKVAANLNTEPVIFTFLDHNTQSQDFLNIAFIYNKKGDYKISLELPEVYLNKSPQMLGKFSFQESKLVQSNDVYISVR